MNVIHPPDKIDIIVAGWEAKVREQNSRVSKKRTPNDIAAIIRNYREFDTGFRKLYRAFPIFYKDTIEDILKKYCYAFAEEAHQYMNDLKERNLYNKGGMSKGKQFRLALELPANLNVILKQYSERIIKAPFPSPWWYKKIKESLPNAFVGSMA